MPAKNEAFTVFIPQNANRIFLDPDTIAHVQTFEETISQLKTVTSEQMQIALAANPRMLVATNGHLQFIDVNTETSDMFLCHKNSCTSEMSAMFAILAEKESDLMNLYNSLADLSKAVTLAPETASNPTRSDPPVVRPESESGNQKTKRNDIFGSVGAKSKYISVTLYYQYRVGYS